MTSFFFRRGRFGTGSNPRAYLASVSPTPSVITSGWVKMRMSLKGVFTFGCAWDALARENFSRRRRRCRGRCTSVRRSCSPGQSRESTRRVTGVRTSSSSACPSSAFCAEFRLADLTLQTSLKTKVMLDPGTTPAAKVSFSSISFSTTSPRAPKYLPVPPRTARTVSAPPS